MHQDAPHCGRMHNVSSLPPVSACYSFMAIRKENRQTSGYCIDEIRRINTSTTEASLFVVVLTVFALMLLLMFRNCYSSHCCNCTLQLQSAWLTDDDDDDDCIRPPKESENGIKASRFLPSSRFGSIARCVAFIP